MWFISNKFVGLPVAFPIITSVSCGLSSINTFVYYNNYVIGMIITGLRHSWFCLGYIGFQRDKGK